MHISIERERFLTAETLEGLKNLRAAHGDTISCFGASVVWPDHSKTACYGPDMHGQGTRLDVIVDQYTKNL